MHLKISFAKWLPFSPGGDELKAYMKTKQQYVVKSNTHITNEFMFHQLAYICRGDEISQNAY